MSQSLVKNYVHLVFSTKYRVPLILPEVEVELHSYLWGICDNLNCQPIKIGGYTDHVHILCLLSKNLALSKMIQELKTGSSAWIKTKGSFYRDFRWQIGYGGFSVSPTKVDSTISYIANQHEHHHNISFQNEYRGLLKKNKIDYDEKYLWD
jgi:putative transposase